MALPVAKKTMLATQPVALRLTVRLPGRITGAMRGMVTDAVGRDVGDTSVPLISNTASKLVVPVTVPDWKEIWLEPPNRASVAPAGIVKGALIPPLLNCIIRSVPVTPALG